MSNQEEQEFLKRHPPMNEAQIKEELHKAEVAKENYTHNVNELEKNLRDFADLTDPITFKNKQGINIPLCWVKRPTRTQLEATIPAEIKPYVNNPLTMPDNLKALYDNLIYQMMADLIVEPKHTAEWWKGNSPVILIPLFNAHIKAVFELVGVDVANF